MEYNSENSINEIKKLLQLAMYDIKSAMGESILGTPFKVSTSTDNLEVKWRECEMAMDYIERARTLIGKMLDEREDEAE